MAESYYFGDARPVALRDGGFLFAFSHSPKPWLVNDFGADVGLFPSTRSYSLFVGMTIVPGLLWVTRGRTHESMLTPIDRGQDEWPGVLRSARSR